MKRGVKKGKQRNKKLVILTILAVIILGVLVCLYIISLKNIDLNKSPTETNIKPQYSPTELSLISERSLSDNSNEIKNMPELDKSTINQLAQKRSGLKDAKANYEIAKKEKSTSVKSLESNINSKNSEIISLLKDRGVSEENAIKLNSQLNEIDEKAVTWTANYNTIFLKDDEYKKRINGLKISETEKSAISNSKSVSGNVITGNLILSNGQSLPDSFDWRNVSGKNYVTDIKDQGNCGSCWAFGAVATLEGHARAWYNNPNLNIDLSEQDLVSCYLPNTYPGNLGCNGALDNQIENIFNNYYKNTGVANEICFPYSATDSSCNDKCSNWQTNVWKTLGYKSIITPDGDLNTNIELIKKALIENGPVEVGFIVYMDFSSYTSGIYSHTTNVFRGGHAVTIVGFGKYDGRDYWIVKNSWGSEWGEKGYFKIFADDSEISNWFAFAVTQPNPPTAQNVLCTDIDKDGYCYWGLGSKPASGCPTSCSGKTIEDCDDSNKNVNTQDNCGKPREHVGTLNISSNPSEAEVYVKDLQIENWVYKGKTPIKFNLSIGYREIKLIKLGYLDYIKKANVNESELNNVWGTLSHDSQFYEGWPKIIGINSNDGSSPEVADLNNDGKNEVIIAVGDPQGPDYCQGVICQNGIYVFDEYGNNIMGWPIFLSNEKLEGNFLSITPNIPAIADIDNDNNLELISAVRNGWYDNDLKRLHDVSIFVWKYNGTLAKGWPVKIENLTYTSTNSVIVNSVITSDIDNDKSQEIILPLYNKIYVFNSNGTMKKGWPKNIGCNTNGDSAIGDINSDGYPEIVYGCGYPNNFSTLYAFSYNGSLLWSKTFDYQSIGSVIIGDINNDNKREIITRGTKFMYSSMIDSINVLNDYGNPIKGFPLFIIPNNSIASPSLGDINNDGQAEIIFNSFNFLNKSLLWVISGSGKIISVWPLAEESYSRVVIGDINNDNVNEIIAGGQVYSDESEIFAFSSNGTIINGWPKKIVGGIRWTSPTIADINGDNKIEILAGVYPMPYNLYEEYKRKYLYIWNLNTTYNPAKMDWPMFQHDPQHTGCYDCDKKYPSFYLSFDEPSLPLNVIMNKILITSDRIKDNKVGIFYPSSKSYINVSKFKPNTEQGTFEAWIKPSSIHNGMIIYAGQNTGDGYGPEQELHLSTDLDGKINFYFGGNSSNAYRLRWPITGKYAINTWYHVAATYKKWGGVKLYINGILVAENNSLAGKDIPTNKWISSTLIGKPRSDTRYFNGTIDEVKIYNRTLSADEIKQDYLMS